MIVTLLSGALVAALDVGDKSVVTLVTIALVGLVHAIAYTAAQGSLRAQRILLCRCADLLVVSAAVFVIRLWID